MEIQNNGKNRKVNNNNKMFNKNQNIKEIENNKINEEEKLNIIEYNDSQLKTKKKEFVNKIDPHNLKRLIQKERYIWFGVHNELLRNKNMIKLLEKCNDKSIPIESAAIHLDKYRIGFNKNRVIIIDDENSVIFFKLYLIKKSQLIEILKVSYSCNNSIEKDITQFFLNKKIKEDFNLNLYQTKSNCFYDVLKCIGELDGINIYSLSSSNNDIEPPDIDYLKLIYNGLLKTFFPYSEYLIMYYIYLLDGIKNYFSIKDLEEVFNQNKMNNGHISSISSETNITIGEVQNQNKLFGITSSNNKNENNIKNYLLNNINNNNNNNNINNKNFSKNKRSKNIESFKDSIEVINETPKQQNIQKNETDTIKCSTCNGSPFICTAEKNQLNQYSYIFDLHHLPIFDETTGEFFWNNNDVNWKLENDSILKSEEVNGKSVNLLNRSLVSLSNDFSTLNGNNIEEGNNSPKKEDDKNNSGTFIEELNNILKEIN